MLSLRRASSGRRGAGRGALCHEGGTRRRRDLRNGGVWLTRSTTIGFVVGIALILLIGGLWLTFGPPVAWPGRLTLALQERQGEQVYSATCLSCHGGPTGGTIEDDPPRHNANGHTWHHPDCALRQMIREGSAGISEVGRSAVPMQPFKDSLSRDEIDAVLAYIRTMWMPWQQQAQATFTREMCFEGSA